MLSAKNFFSSSTFHAIKRSDRKVGFCFLDLFCQSVNKKMMASKNLS